MQNNKIIKKLVQTAALILLLLFTLPFTAFLLLQSRTIQTKVADKVMQVISENLGTQCSLRRIDVSFPYRVRLQHICFKDLADDTLLYAANLTVGIRYINFAKKEVFVGSINLEKALVRLSIDSAYHLNLRDFLDQLRGDGQGKGAWAVRFNNLRLRNSRFELHNYYKRTLPYGVNYSDLQLSDIDADVKRFKPSRDSLSFFVKSLHFNEKSGFVMEKMSCEFSESLTFLSFRKIKMQTNRSLIQGREISLLFSGWSKFKADSFNQHVHLKIDLDQTQVNFHDIGYFTPIFATANQDVYFSGKVTGPLSSLKGKGLEVLTGGRTRFQGDLSFDGLPRFDETFILAEIQELTTHAPDIASLPMPNGRHMKLPETLSKLGLISYRGSFTGFLNDFVAYGLFQTELGNIRTDLLFRPDTSNYLDFEGSFDIRDFHIGKLLEADKQIGRITMGASINGTSQSGSIGASIKASISSFDFRGYNYSQITLSGNIDNRTYDGRLNMNDPNAELEFEGKVDLEDSVGVFDFRASITDANLYALNLDKSDPQFKASCYLIANARGSSINNLNGEIKLLNSLFTKSDKQLQIYDFSIQAENHPGSNHLQVRSDFLDADLNGSFKISQLGASITHFIQAYLPSLSDSSIAAKVAPQHSLNLKATVKHAKSLMDFFAPGYQIAENTHISLTYQPEKHHMQMFVNTPQIRAKLITWNNLDARVISNSDSIHIEAGGKNLTLGNRITLENFTLITRCSDDASALNIRWNNWQDLQYRGDIRALGKLSRSKGSRLPHMDLTIFPSVFVTNDTLWNISPAKVSIDSSRISFHNLAVHHGKDFIGINGTLSEDPDHELLFTFSHFNLGNLNGITMPSGFALGGILDGEASLADAYNNTLFKSLLTIDSLMINREILGKAIIRSTWDDHRSSLDLQAHAMRDNLRTVEINGSYLPSEQGKLDFTMHLNKLRLNLFNPYVSSIFSDLRGAASGKATLSGTVQKPLLNGTLNLQKTTFTINYLQTRYNFSEKVEIENNNIYFKEVRIYDPKGNSAYLTGAIRNKYLKNFQFDLAIRSKEFLCMNTTQNDNKLFYGTAYATGLIKIQGPPRNITMDISATTDKNTSIKIPLSNTGELDEYQFISIHNLRDADHEEAKPGEYQVNLSGLRVNFDLTVTPDAEVQIIFDPKLGDIIKGKGNGNLDMKISSSGNFLMYGDYTIEEGDYLFTLQNFINKKLTIEPGGTIRWNGDPFDATIDIVALYRTKASLKDLFGTSDEYGSKIIVDDRITMTGKLMSPDVKYDIHLPNADEKTRLSVMSSIATSEELNKQFIALLTLNRFVLSTQRSGVASLNTSSTSPYSSAAGVNASEFLSNQLSHWLSQINNDLDIGVNYRTNREMKSNEVQIALSTQLFNDKLTINSSLDVATNAAVKETDNIVGEFDIDYKITRNGKLRLKTYNHANNDMLYDNPYTQGLGIFYREDFDTLGELWRDYLRAVFGKKEEEPVVPSQPDTPGESDKDG